MFKFIKRLFTKKHRKMFTEQELKSLENKLKNVHNELEKQSKKSDDKGVLQSYKALDMTIELSLKNLENIREVQNEISGIRKFDDFKE
ncbi:MAG: hypothetical protein QNK23_00890 [Crocinitomicaceae bacterium]|nr:hypothetical protein [Crocinitomicaceae bacterium]